MQTQVYNTRAFATALNSAHSDSSQVLPIVTSQASCHCSNTGEYVISNQSVINKYGTNLTKSSNRTAELSRLDLTHTHAGHAAGSRERITTQDCIQFQPAPHAGIQMTRNQFPTSNNGSGIQYKEYSGFNAYRGDQASSISRGGPGVRTNLPNMTNAQTTPPPGMESEVDQKTLQFQTRQHVLEALSYHIATSTSPQHRSPKRKPVQIAFKNKQYDINQETDENCDFPLYHFRRPHQEES